MDNEQKFWLRLWQSVFLSVVLFAAIVAIYNTYIKSTAFENGYEMRPIPGCNYPVWQNNRKQHEQSIQEIKK